ncbi:hypothetical protein [Streptomyces sp. NPDC007088]|uniref:hypothetical protein n=1 Tax=Streptomyces sp. NPDC007088 TaxID=3364773 RepID=UPI0036B036FB
MRNAEAITVMSAKLAAALSAHNDTPISPLTAADIEAHIAHARTTPGTTDLHPFYQYLIAMTPDGLARSGYRPFAELYSDLWCALDVLSEYVRESMLDLADVRMPDPDAGYDPDEVAAQPDLTPADWQTYIEDYCLARMPAAFRPDGPNGPLIEGAAGVAAEAVVLATWTPDEREISREEADRWVRDFAPSDFTPHSTGHRAVEAEKTAAGWAALAGRRDEIIRSAYADGVTKSRLHEITHLSRVTINAILNG